MADRCAGCGGARNDDGPCPICGSCTTVTDLLDETRIVDQQAARIERLRGALGLVVTSDSHDLAKALAAETLRQDDATRR